MLSQCLMSKAFTCSTFEKGFGYSFFKILPHPLCLIKYEEYLY